MDQGPASLLLLARTLLLFAALILPDIVLLRDKLLAVKRKKLAHYLVLLLALALLIAGAGAHPAAGALIVLAFALSFAWHLSYLYFGEVLKPESLLLFVKPDHFADALEAGLEDFRRLVPAALLAAGSALAGLLVAYAVPSPFPGAWNMFALAASALLAAIGLRAALLANESAVYPVLAMPGVIGALHAVALALKWWLRDRADGGGLRPVAISYAFRHVEETPITVAVLMGEGIAPSRMSMFGNRDSTPLLAGRCAETGRFRLLARRGFSLGVSSNSSIAAFLSGSPFPERIASARSLFDLAKQQGFATHYFSGQRRSPLDLTAGAGAVDRVETREAIERRYAERKDWTLVDLVREAGPHERAFFFLYPRVNHTPYYNHQLGTDERHYPHPRSSDEMVHNYEVGLRAYDRFADALLEAFAERPGAVFVFVTSDHNEFLGEGGLWGHNISGSLAGALVPVMLFTNRPDHSVTHAFEALALPDGFQVVRLVMQALGVEAKVQPFEAGTFFVNNALPYGRAGHFAVTRTSDPTLYEVVQADRAGGRGKPQEVRISQLAGASAAP